MPALTTSGPKFKFLVLTTRFEPQVIGSGRFAYTASSKLVARGHDVVVITDAILRKSHININFPFEVLYLENLEQMSIGGLGSLVQMGLRLHEIIHSQRIDVVYVHDLVPLLVISMLGETVDVPVLFCFHNTPSPTGRLMGVHADEELDREFARSIVKLDQFDLAFIGSQAFERSADSLGIHKAKRVTCSFGIDLHPFLEITSDQNDKVDSVLGTNPEHKVVLLPSRCTPRKGIIDSLDALEELITKSPDVRLVLTGMSDPFDASHASQVWKLIRDRALEEFTIVPSSVISQEMLPALYRRADVIIVPSHYEGLGLSAIEAMAAGRPLVATDVPGLNEFIRDRVNCLVVPAGDGSSLASAVLEILESPRLATALSNNAKQTSMRYDIDPHITQIVNSATELLSRRA